MTQAMRAVRTLVLGGSAATFGLIAVAAVFAPAAVATQYGYPLERFEAFNEFRAIFVGFWAGLALLMGTAARRHDLPLLGDLCGAMLLLQACGRVLSMAIDGVPAPRFIGACALEALSGLAVLLARKR